MPFFSKSNNNDQSNNHNEYKALFGSEKEKPITLESATPNNVDHLTEKEAAKIDKEAIAEATAKTAKIDNEAIAIAKQELIKKKKN